MKYLILFLFMFSGFEAVCQSSHFKHVNFKKADSIAEVYKHETLSNLPVLVHKLTFQLNSDVEKFRVIYKWVSSNVEGDYSFYLKIMRKRQKFKNDANAFNAWNKKLQKRVFNELVTNQRSICSGYAYLIKELATLSGIACEIVDGYCRSVNSEMGKLGMLNHSWNAVKLNDNWYLADATLASGYFNVNENKFIKNYNDGYFLADPELLIKSHYPLDLKWTCLNETPSVETFTNGPIIYGNTLKHAVVPVYPNTLQFEVFKDETIQFKLKFLKEVNFDAIEISISNGINTQIIDYEGLIYENKMLMFNYEFRVKGTYDIHLKIDEDIVVSYGVEVVKRRIKA